MSCRASELSYQIEINGPPLSKHVWESWAVCDVVWRKDSTLWSRVCRQPRICIQEVRCIGSFCSGAYNLNHRQGQMPPVQALPGNETGAAILA